VKTVSEYPLVVFHRPNPQDREKAERLKALGVELAPIRKGPHDGLDLEQVLERIAGMKLSSVLVEGGRAVATEFLRRRLVQRLHVFIAPTIFGEAKAIQGIGPLPGARIELVEPECSFVGADTYLTGRLVYL
jgi:riboflavin biosynthesis pyrimidine reductase